MEISMVNAAEVNTSEQNGDPSPLPSPTLPEEKVLVSGTPQYYTFLTLFYNLLELKHFNFVIVVEVCLKPSSTARIDDVRLSVERYAIFNISI